MEQTMKHSESLKNISPAIAKAQAAIHGVVANQKNPFFNSMYADMDACWKAVKGPLLSEGIALVQTMGFIPGAGPTVITTLLHESGEYISGEQPVCAKSDDPQALGAAITYARRYGLSAIISLVEVDDDAEKSMGRDEGKKESSNDDVPKFPGPKLVNGEAPMCPSCQKKMMLSKYPDKITGQIGWYCIPCKKSVPRTA
jgi:hypothetical protein